MTEMTEEAEALAKGAAILATCIIHSLNRRDPGCQKTFLQSLEEAHAILRDEVESRIPNDLPIAMLRYTRTLLTGFDVINGQNGPFLPNWPHVTSDRYDPHRPETYYD
jgi:hypothetical protein